MAKKQTNAKSDGLQVICVGLSRTGTYSLVHALDILGFGPCHHFAPIFIEDTFPYWNHWRWAKVFKLRGDKNKAERQALIHQLFVESGCKSGLDYPTAGLVEDLVEMYPDAKFILGVRSSAQAWRTSFNNTIGAVRSFPRYQLTYLLPFQRAMHYFLGATEEWDDERLGVNMWIPRDGLDIYYRHNDHVRRVVPKDRLLEFEPKMGFPPLCKFLGVQEPTDEKGNKISYPRVNDTAQFLRGIRIALVIGILYWAVFLGGLGFAVKRWLLPGIQQR